MASSLLRAKKQPALDMTSKAGFYAILFREEFIQEVSSRGKRLFYCSVHYPPFKAVQRWLPVVCPPSDVESVETGHALIFALYRI